jgi:indole-3-glycerol phosphate synthase
LDKIVPAVRRRLDERRAALPIEALIERLPQGRPASFRDAIAAPGVSLIAEVKRASPSKGPIRPDLQVADLVRAYERAGARAISVLTEEDFFLGSLEDLREAAATTRLPLLRKDFIVDEYQIYEARIAGASAVLLIAALLSDDEIARLADCAAQLGLDVLLEVHDLFELFRALTREDVVVGINNRDLHTFEVSLQITEVLGAMAPPERPLVGESGIRSNEEVRRLAAGGVDGVLVGETLLRCADVEQAIRELMGFDRAAEGS